jgi:Xaa-Pro aminopeptidase
VSKNESMSSATSTATYTDRINRARARMQEADIDVLLVSVGRDLPYLSGYEAMPLERLTMLVVPKDADATLVVPRMEAPRVVHRPDVFTLLPWDETEDPIAIVAGLVGRPAIAAVGDTMWARFLVDLLVEWPSSTTRYVRSTEVMNALRMRKDADEIAALAAAGAAVDRIAAELQAGRIPLIGRTEAEVSADLGVRILAEGHQRVNFAIVAAGENAASPHHHAGGRLIHEGEIVLCDFGGTMDGYCSDITRCVFLGEPPAEVAEAYAVLHEAQRAAVLAGIVGTPCEEVDRVARGIISAAGYGEYFMHRTGHGIGMEEHEDPYMVEGNGLPLEPGHAFSVEPGIYLPGRWGMRLEDIVVATEAGPLAVNNVDHALVAVAA